MGEFVHLRGAGIVKILSIRKSGFDGSDVYRVGFGAMKLKPREYSEYDLDYKVSPETAAKINSELRTRSKLEKF